MHFLKKKPKPPIAEAIEMVRQAVKIAYRYKHDKKHIIANSDLIEMDRLSKNLYEAHSTVQYIIHCIEQHARETTKRS